MSEPSWTLAEVAELYDGASRMSDMFSNGYEHLGYFYGDEDTATVEEAARRLTLKVADTLGLRLGEHLLDAGCGIGAPATLIAAETGAQVTGVTISPVEAGNATARATASGLSDQVKFEVGDFHALPFPEGHFDAVIAMESLMHAIDLDKVLLEFLRVLRPGGRIAISETTMVDPTATLPSMFRSRTPMTSDGWLKEVRAAGFVVEEWIQCGHRVYGGSKRYVERTEEIRDQLVAAFGEEFFQAIKHGQHETFAPGPEVMSYLILSARKPA
jgi:cyclopropane fatty-acyl-phospholipid synthase-like methyltransferase